MNPVTINIHMTGPVPAVIHALRKVANDLEAAGKNLDGIRQVLMDGMDVPIGELTVDEDKS